MHFGLGTRLILYLLHYQTPCISFQQTLDLAIT
jgi:hypothetical protein